MIIVAVPGDPAGYIVCHVPAFRYAAVWWVNDSKIKEFVREGRHALKAIHVVKSIVHHTGTSKAASASP